MNPQLETFLETVRRAELTQFMDVVVDTPFVRCPWNGESLLHVAAIWGEVEAVRLLLDTGVEVDLKGEDDFTALHSAIEQGHSEVIKLLLARGADPERKCIFGNAYELAAMHDNAACVKYV